MVNRLNRYELKYKYEPLDFKLIYNEIMLSPYLFKETHQLRRVNNVYFDSVNYFSYEENLSGVGNREKYRIRWYEPFFIQTRLEKKIKEGQLGYKKFYGIAEIDKATFNWNDYKNSVLVSNMCEITKQELLSKIPTVYVSYDRRYFVSACQRFRFTIDFNITYQKISNGRIQKRIVKEDNIVLELKFNEEDYSEAKLITNHLSERMVSNSKFVNGTESFI